MDGDGLLDLYVCNYVDFGPNTKPQFCTVQVGKKSVTLGCEPGAYKSLKGVCYRNLGGGRFADVTHAWGLDQTTGPGLGAAFADVDGTGRPDLAIANDEKPGDLFQAGKRGRWQNNGAASGTATDAQGRVHGGMGMDWGDYDNDGQLDLMVCTFEGQVKNLYHNQGGGSFQDVSTALGIAHFTNHGVAFGGKFLDADNDGWLDLLITNGHTYDNVADILPGRHYRQTTQLLMNVEGKRYMDASKSAGLEGLPPVVGRGLAIGDYDNDGRVDALVVNSEGKPQLLHNETTSPGNWLRVKLIGVKSNRDGYGASLTAQSGGLSQTRLCHADGSYLSSSDARVHFGLGQARTATLTIRWPSGTKTVYANVPANQTVVFREDADSQASPQR